MTPAQYLAGAVALGIALASLGLAAGRLRQALLPGYRGATGHLASVILGLALLVCVLQTAGSIGELRRGVVVVAVPAVALLVAVAAPRLGRRRAGPADTGREPRPTARGRTRPPVVVALVLAALVVAQWSVHTSAAMERGMSDLDSLRYHGPFAARFVQQHSVTGLQRTSAENQETYFPGNAEMLDAYGILLFGSDVLTPVRNLGWLALALLAGWCGGARFGHGPAALAGVAAVCSTPLLATIEPGSAKNDVAALALVLAAAALALHALPDPPARGPRLAGLALAGAAGGLAAGTKLTVLGPLAALGAGAWLLSGPGHRRRAALCLAIPALATGALWYVRNLVHTGTPLPWFRIDLGFVTLAGPPMPFDERFAHSVAHYSGSVGFWTQTALPGLLHSFGALGPLLVAGGAGAAVTATKGRSRPARLVGAVALAGMVAYLFTPWGAGGPEGDPRLFAADLRFLAPALGLAAIAAAGSRLAPAALAGAAVLVSVDVAQSAGGGSSLVATVVLAAALCGAVVAAGRARAWPARLPAGALAAAVAVVGVGVGGWPVQRDYLDDRYAGNQLGHGIELPMFRHISGARVAVGGFADDYQLYGLGLSNQVQFNGVTGPDGSYRRAATCEEWLTGLQAGGYDYVVVSVSPAAHHVTPPPEEEWTEADPSAYEVERSGLTTVFRLVGRPDPASCGAPRLA